MVNILIEAERAKVCELADIVEAANAKAAAVAWEQELYGGCSQDVSEAAYQEVYGGSKGGEKLKAIDRSSTKRRKFGGE